MLLYDRFCRIRVDMLLYDSKMTEYESNTTGGLIKKPSAQTTRFFLAASRVEEVKGSNTIRLIFFSHPFILLSLISRFAVV